MIIFKTKAEKITGKKVCRGGIWMTPSDSVEFDGLDIALLRSGEISRRFLLFSRVSSTNKLMNSPKDSFLLSLESGRCDSIHPFLWRHIHDQGRDGQSVGADAYVFTWARPQI